MAEIGSAPGISGDDLLSQFRDARGLPSATMADMFAAVFGLYPLKTAYDAFVTSVDARINNVLDKLTATRSTRTIYSSSATDATVTGANVRLSMLPADARSGSAFLSVPAGALPVGAQILLMGAGTIGARLTTPPGFNFIPWVRTVGGAKVDLPGFAMGPLLGTDGTCEVWMTIVQTTNGLRTGGYVRYGATNGMPYSVALNPGGTGAAGALPTIVASDPTVDREFGVDGFWGTGADGREYVRCRAVTALLSPGS